MNLLKIVDYKVKVEGEEILKGVNLEIAKGEIHCVMGPNGSGKSTLVNSLMGHPSYEYVGGNVLLEGADLMEMEAFERSLNGLFLAFQYPKEIPGVSMLNFLMASYNAHLVANDPEAKTMKAFRFKKMISANVWDTAKEKRTCAGKYELDSIRFSQRDNSVQTD